MYDALIIGAGPAGSQLAYRLASWGHRVLVVEEHPQSSPLPCCTGIIGQECRERFSLPAGLVLREARSAQIFSPSGKVLRLEKDTPQAFIVDRGALDRLLAERAQGAGAEYLWSYHVTDVAQDEGWAGVVLASNGKATLIKGRALAVACGFGSPLPRRLGLGVISHYAIGAQAVVEVDRLEGVEVYCGRAVAPGFFAWLVPTSPGKGLAGLMGHRPTPSIQAFLSWLKEQGKIASWGGIGYRPIPLQPLPRSYGARLLALGGAAGQAKPTSGGGIYYGLLAAEMAAQTLHEALLRDNLSPASLAVYEKKWRQALGRELGMGYWVRRLYARLSDSQLDAALRFLESSGLLNSVLGSGDFSFDWHSRAILHALGQEAGRWLWGQLRLPALRFF